MSVLKGVRLRRAVPIAAAGTVATAAVTAGIVLADADRRLRLDRQARVWWLTSRRAINWAIVKARGRRATDEQRRKLEEQFAIRTAQDVADLLGGMKGAIMKAGQMV
ncbi:MAG TPA: hypothetical protein VF711_02425, partial [Acidimicrobiales bacterium]